MLYIVNFVVNLNSVLVVVTRMIYRARTHTISLNANAFGTSRVLSASDFRFTCTKRADKMRLMFKKQFSTIHAAQYANVFSMNRCTCDRQKAANLAKIGTVVVKCIMKAFE